MPLKVKTQVKTKVIKNKSLNKRQKRFNFLASGFRFQISDFRFQVSGFRFQVSGFRFLGCGLWVVGLGLGLGFTLNSGLSLLDFDLGVDLEEASPPLRR